MEIKIAKMTSVAPERKSPALSVKVGIASFSSSKRLLKRVAATPASICPSALLMLKNLKIVPLIPSIIPLMVAIVPSMYSWWLVIMFIKVETSCGRISSTISPIKSARTRAQRDKKIRLLRMAFLRCSLVKTVPPKLLLFPF